MSTKSEEVLVIQSIEEGLRKGRKQLPKDVFRKFIKSDSLSKPNFFLNRISFSEIL